MSKVIRAQLENEIPQDLPLEKDFREGTDYTITDQYVTRVLHSNKFLMIVTVLII